jgi:hypothetical protein
MGTFRIPNEFAWTPDCGELAPATRGGKEVDAERCVIVARCNELGLLPLKPVTGSQPSVIHSSMVGKFLAENIHLCVLSPPPLLCASFITSFSVSPDTVGFG